VDSTIIRVDLYPSTIIDTNSLGTFFKLARAGFSQKRKTLRNSLSAGLGLSPVSVTQLLMDAGVDPRRRAETLSLAEWGKLVENYSERLS
jgi:16S rRNA (adenine1518-N6/adenine1519-N6)-dimethyltransferase